MNALAALLTFVFVMPANSLLRAWVAVKLWGWFVVPLGVQQVGVATALGVSLLVNLFTIKFASDEAVEKEKRKGGIWLRVFTQQLTWALAVLFTLLTGWVVKAVSL